MGTQFKQRIVHVMRAMRLLPLIEKINNQRFAWLNEADDAAFSQQHPDFELPPRDLIHETFGGVSYYAFWIGGRQDAELLANLILRHKPDARRILEWGCGPARILAHIPQLLRGDIQFAGTDYNAAAITWCRKAIPNVIFTTNDLDPPLNFGDSSFDVIYGMSVLTHLSITRQNIWLRELRRILQPDGLLILTTHGNNHVSTLLAHERDAFANNGIVVREEVEEGSRCFVSYHRPDHAQQTLFHDFMVCEHIPGHSPEVVLSSNGTRLAQDIWLLRKPATALSESTK